MDRRTKSQLSASDEAHLRSVIPEDWAALKRARERLGKDPGDRLRWAVKFAQLDLRGLDPATTFDLGYQLLALVPGQGAYPRAPGPMSERLIRRLQKRILEGLGRIVRREGEWAVPKIPVYISRFNKPGSRRVQFQVRWQAAREEDAIIYGVTELVRTTGERLRACPVCDRLFLANRRQDYCAASCSQRMRNRKRRDRQSRKNQGA